MLVNKQYGLINLPIPIGMGNVLTTVSDRKIPHTSDNITIDYYTSDITSAQDYYPFGMLMPGRNFSSNNYKFGFNGKLNDNEVFGATGSFQDYGMRMYDTRVCRFIRVDPLKDKYPHLSTYQYAENRPIDGIDLNGLEYYTYNIDIKIKSDGSTTFKKELAEDWTKVSENLLNEIHGTKEFFKEYSKGFGPQGPGVKYQYTISYEKPNGEVQQTKATLFFDRSGITKHGIYYGEGCPTEKGYEHNFYSNPYDYLLEPIDEVDALAKEHDKAYDFENYTNWYSDTRTISADLKFVKGLYNYLDKVKQEGYKDKYTGRAPSKEAISAAENAAFLFSKILGIKTSLVPFKKEVPQGKTNPSAK